MSPPPRTIPPFEFAGLLEEGPFGDWRDELHDQGYTVVKGVIPRERAEAYRQRAFDWLEGFGRGFKRDDPSTFGQDFVPVFHRGGMYASSGFHQEQFVWDIRCESGVREAFAKLWGTNELVSSMDGGTIMLPGNECRPGEPTAWPHIDLNPSRVGFFCAQGIVNLGENGPQDGGLLVLPGSNKVIKDFFDEFGRPPIPEGSKIDTYKFTEQEMKWFDNKGLKWHKVCAKPGDLILWDSATIHYNCLPEGNRDRTITYVCMGPARLVTDEDRKVRERAFKDGAGTSHAPFGGSFYVDNHAEIREGTGKPCPQARWRLNQVKPTLEVLRLAGLAAY